MELHLKVNGEAKVFQAGPRDRLADLLRREGYFGVKLGCRTGDCGSCTVLVDGKPLKSCMVPAAKAEGKEITTIEGLAQDGKLHPLQEQFLAHGAVQCGFCTPGMILAAKALLDENPDPDEAAVRKALKGVLCRCTGYEKPVRAVLAAAKVMRGEPIANPTVAVEEARKFRVVGRSVPRVDGLQLVTGRPAFTDDFRLPGMLYAKILWSPHAHARIRRIDKSKAEALPGVRAVLTYKDVPRVAYTRAGQDYPEPSPYDYFILDKKVRYVGDRVAAVAADSLEIAEEALKLIEVEYEPLPAVFSPEEALAPGAPVIHDEPEARGIYDPKRNICAHVDVQLGDVKRGFEEADLVLENEYRTHRVQHAQLEPHITITYLDEHDRLVVRTSNQVPFHIRRQLSQVLGLPVGRIRVIKPRIGGGFGGKQEMVLEDICAALTLATRRPVRLELTREEDFRSARTRHPMIIRMKSGVKRDGTLVANEMVALVDAGAYGSHSPTVPSNTGNKNLPRYRCPNIRYAFTAAYTNLPISGAMRGYGTPQGAFALECQIDELAYSLGMDPLDFRLKNIVRAGDVDRLSPLVYEIKSEAANDWVIQGNGLEQCILKGAELIRWKERRREFEEWNKKNPRLKRGLGMACLSQGSGVAGIDKAAATIKLNEDGSFNLFVGATDLGTGADTVLAQIAAEVLGVDVEAIIVYGGDTDFCPFDSGAYASSTTYVSGGAVKKAAELVKDQLLEVAGRMLGEEPESLRLEAKKIISDSGKEVPLSEVAIQAFYREKFQVEATASNCSPASPPPFAAQFAEIEVDTETGKMEVNRFLSVVDCGTAINPALAEGQVEGAVAQGLGYALFEEMAFDGEGRLLNPSYRHYPILRADQMPRLETVLVQTFEPSGPYGAKAVGEIAINGPAPAIANAVYHALGVRIRSLPITPAKVLKALGRAP
ncbi:MAG: molybdopterin-dependent oxidoreductase [Candidatus Acetothermia bacterium]|nr:molybdopterin-dependent oxidoreductase [Candidatus Acetothermia bacterium]MDH7505086.1 molybdopterin-dependent oxidoreductase [Candidatus Acetothermia bacterium]